MYMYVRGVYVRGECHVRVYHVCGSAIYEGVPHVRERMHEGSAMCEGEGVPHVRDCMHEGCVMCALDV